MSDAVLVAIAIPIFTSQLEKSREGVDASNIRAKYAEIMADAITGDTTGPYTVKLKQQEDGFTKITPEWPANLDVKDASVKKDATLTLTYDATTKKVTAQ